MKVDGVINNATLATFAGHGAAYGLIKCGCIAWCDGRIAYVGEQGSAPNFVASVRLDAEGCLLTPGLIDCHTHVVYAGDRAEEFEWRLHGSSYESIAQQGGGIMSTVDATRGCDQEALFDLSLKRLRRLMSSGVTTVEIKSGYGLDAENEIKILQVIQRLKRELPITIQATCLTAHCLPSTYTGSADEYINWLCNEFLPELAKQDLVDAVDIFCEKIAFTCDHARQLFAAATQLGLPVKGHVEQLTQTNGSDVVCEFKGLSADHLEYATEEQVLKMRGSGVTAVLLPGAHYYLRGKQVPPIATMRSHKVPMAIASDMNPGSSPISSIIVAANMASVLFGLTPEEALAGITIHAAMALGLERTKGKLFENMDADFILWPLSQPNQLIYELPGPLPEAIWIAGVKQSA